MVKFTDLKKISLPADYTELTQSERRQVREEYVRQQKGLCWCCRQPLDGPARQVHKLDMRLFPRGFLNNPIHLHHDHKTNLTIGAVHAYCNGYLWQYLGE